MNRWTVVGTLILCSMLTAMVWPLEEATKIIEASPIKNWTSNEYVTYTDLNNNFNHLHANLGHGHGPIITANDISSNAQIRPEQTTFGPSLTTSRGLVYVGTHIINPDGGTLYNKLNYAGTLSVDVYRSASGYTVSAGAGSGALQDAGTMIYSIFTQQLDLGLTASNLTMCFPAYASTVLASPLTYSAICQTVASFSTVAVNAPPPAVSVQIYSNKVQ